MNSREDIDRGLGGRFEQIDVTSAFWCLHWQVIAYHIVYFIQVFCDRFRSHKRSMGIQLFHSCLSRCALGVSAVHRRWALEVALPVSFDFSLSAMGMRTAVRFGTSRLT